MCCLQMEVEPLCVFKRCFLHFETACLVHVCPPWVIRRLSALFKKKPSACEQSRLLRTKPGRLIVPSNFPRMIKMRIKRSCCCCGCFFFEGSKKTKKKQTDFVSFFPTKQKKKKKNKTVPIEWLVMLISVYIASRQTHWCNLSFSAQGLSTS